MIWCTSGSHGIALVGLDILNGMSFVWILEEINKIQIYVQFECPWNGMSSFWQNFHHWLQQNLSFWQHLVQPAMKILSKWLCLLSVVWFLTCVSISEHYPMPCAETLVCYPINKARQYQTHQGAPISNIICHSYRKQLEEDHCSYLKASPPGQNGRHFADDIFRFNFMNEKFCILIKISLKFIPKCLIDNNPALV